MRHIVSFQALLQRFFTDRLIQQRQASAHTISSYRDTFRLLLRFAHKRLHKTPDQLAFEDINAPLVTAFLNDPEKTRDVSARTRNLRLTAIRSFKDPGEDRPEGPRHLRAVLRRRGGSAG